MEQNREPIGTAGAGRFQAQPVRRKRTVPATGTKAMRAAMVQTISKTPAQAACPPTDSIRQARQMLAEQRRHFDELRTAITQMGESLDRVNTLTRESLDRQPQALTLLNAQSEAIQGLTLLALKGQEVQAALISAADVQSHRLAAMKVPGWLSYTIGFLLLGSVLGVLI